jgi:hypothetical protein
MNDTTQGENSWEMAGIDGPLWGEAELLSFTV